MHASLSDDDQELLLQEVKEIVVIKMAVRGRIKCFIFNDFIVCDKFIREKL